MRKIILAILCLFLSSPCLAAEPVQLARTNPYVAGAGASAAAYVEEQSFGNEDYVINLANTAARKYLALAFTTVGAYTLKKLAVDIKKVAAGQDVTCYIYDDSTGPSTLLGTSTNTVLAANISTSFTNPYAVQCTFAGVALSPTTKYYAVVMGGGVSGTNYLACADQDAAAGTYVSDDTVVWDWDNNVKGTFKTYSGGP
jgi:hypothetical protein